MDRSIWANLLYFENNFWFSLNEEIADQPTLLFLIEKKQKESLREFLKRAKILASEKKIDINKMFVYLDFDSKGSLRILDSKKLHSNYKLMNKNFFGSFDIEIKQSLLETIIVASTENKIEIVTFEFSSQVLVLYLERKLNSKDFWILQTQKNSLQLLKFEDAKLKHFKQVEFHWEETIKKLKKSFHISRDQIELFLFSGFNLMSKNFQSLHPQIKGSSCAWHLKRLLKTSLAKLENYDFLDKPLIVLGFLSRMRGFEEFLERLFLKLKVAPKEKSNLFSRQIYLHNRAFNHYLWDKKLLGNFAYNTGDFEIKFTKTNKMFGSFQKLLNNFFKLHSKQANKYVQR